MAHVEPQTIADIFAEQTRDLIDGAAEDVREYALTIGRGLSYAAANGRDDLVTELRAQLDLLAERQRVRAVGAGWDTVHRVFDTLAAFALRVVAAL